MLKAFFLLVSFTGLVAWGWNPTATGPLLLTEDGQTTQSPSLTPISDFDPQRFYGTWYELALIPNRFQKDCSGLTHAHYQPSPNPRIVQVLNRCAQRDGKFQQAKGFARVEEPGVLSVTFVSILGRPIFLDTRNYWIIGKDGSWRWIVVGHPSRRYGWILSRETQLTPADWDQILRVLETNGYNPCSFVTTPQSGPGAFKQKESLCRALGL